MQLKPNQNENFHHKHQWDFDRSQKTKPLIKSRICEEFLWFEWTVNNILHFLLEGKQ